jgi:hypothetical protein
MFMATGQLNGSRKSQALLEQVLQPDAASTKTA